ncbi:hypothetical protein K3495_g9807 [Podosphaera aphanis]|nr:hypothetical protein K3495_g9807 [Podosphaera aphanis]
MSPKLLPASAAAFEPRAASVNVVLNAKVEPWLTQILRRTCHAKYPLITMAHHQRLLEEKLSSATAMWTLTSLMMPRAPFAELSTNPNPLVEALSNYQIIHLEAYVVHVDMVSQNEVAFKLTSNSIDALVHHHKHVHCVDLLAHISAEMPVTHQWKARVEGLHADFTTAVNKFVYRTQASILENIEEDGSGELSSEKSEEVKKSMTSLFQLPHWDLKVFKLQSIHHKLPTISNSWLSSAPRSVELERESLNDTRSRSDTEIYGAQSSLSPYPTQLYPASVTFYNNSTRGSNPLHSVTPFHRHEQGESRRRY